MFNILKASFILLIIGSLTACTTDGNVFYASKAYLNKSCGTLNREHTQLGRNVRALMVKSLRARKSYSLAKKVSKSYTNWPVYFIVKGNAEFNGKMRGYKNTYQKIRYAALANKCSFFRDVMATKSYKSAASKY